MVTRIARAVQAVEIDIAGQAIGQPFGSPFDLGSAGQEGEDRARLAGQCGADSGGDTVLDALAAVAADVALFDREHPPLAFQPDQPGHQRFIGGAIKRCRHQQQPQVGAQCLACLQHQCQRQIAVEAAFMDFVEQHGGNAGKLGIGDQHAGEDAFGDDIDAGGGRGAAVHAGAIADGGAKRCAAGFGHALGSGARGEAARRQQQDPAGAHPGFADQRRGNRSGLAGSRRRDQRHGGIGGKRGTQRRQHLLHRQRHQPGQPGTARRGSGRPGRAVPMIPSDMTGTPLTSKVVTPTDSSRGRT